MTGGRSRPVGLEGASTKKASKSSTADVAAPAPQTAAAAGDEATNNASKHGKSSGGFMQGFLPGIQDPRIKPKAKAATAASEASSNGKSASALKTPSDGDDASYSPSRQSLLATTLYAGIGRQIKKDFGRFHWASPGHAGASPSVRRPPTNMLLIGERGNITPCHYDEQQNMFAQVRGRKRIVLYSPKYWSSFTRIRSTTWQIVRARWTYTGQILNGFHALLRRAVSRLSCSRVRCCTSRACGSITLSVWTRRAQA